MYAVPWLFLSSGYTVQGHMLVAVAPMGRQPAVIPWLSCREGCAWEQVLAVSRALSLLVNMGCGVELVSCGGKVFPHTACVHLLFRPVTPVFTVLPWWREGLQHESAPSQWFGAVLSLVATGEGSFCVHSPQRCPSVKYFLAGVSAVLWAICEVKWY